jgi:diguanylate cyclase (GGDEF)-like protein
MATDTYRVPPQLPHEQDDRRRPMALSAAAIFAGGTLLNLIEANIPSGPGISLIPGIGALVVAILLYAIGPRLPIWVMACLGPAGATLIAVAVATTEGPGDGATLYIWPVLWETYWFGRRGAAAIVAWVAVVHALALLYLPPADGYLDRWLDVVISVGLVAVVLELLATRNRRLVAQLVAEARLDKLTGLLNRRGFIERAEIELARARRGRGRLAIASFDLDHFKAINDEYGHEVGDRVLVRVTRAFAAEMREVDVLARMGGEEFVALLPGEGAEEAATVAERVRERLARASDPDLPHVTVSAGVAALSAPGDLDELLRAADQALYEAKSRGRDRTVAAGAGRSTAQV